MASLVLDNLSIGYGNSVIQSDLQLTASGGQLIGLLGQNGCGKSTLLRTLACLQPALSGAIRIDDADLTTMPEHEQSRLLSVVLTDRLSVEKATVRDVVAMGRYPYSTFLGGLTDEDNRLIDDALSRTEMMHKVDSFFNCLSDGEKQRVLIAKALAQQTPFIFLDEPTAHLDLPNRIKTLLLLRSLAHSTGKCVLISTHELDLALQTSDVLWLMSPHKGVEVGTPEGLIANGSFERAFADSHFRFVAEGRSLRIEVAEV